MKFAKKLQLQIQIQQNSAFTQRYLRYYSSRTILRIWSVYAPANVVNLRFGSPSQTHGKLPCYWCQMHTRHIYYLTRSNWLLCGLSRPFAAIFHGRQKLYNSNYILKCSFLLFVGLKLRLCFPATIPEEEIRGFTQWPELFTLLKYTRKPNGRHVYVSLFSSTSFHSFRELAGCELSVMRWTVINWN